MQFMRKRQIPYFLWIAFWPLPSTMNQAEGQAQIDFITARRLLNHAVTTLVVRLRVDRRDYPTSCSFPLSL